MDTLSCLKTNKQTENDPEAFIKLQHRVTLDSLGVDSGLHIAVLEHLCSSSFILKKSCKHEAIHYDRITLEKNTSQLLRTAFNNHPGERQKAVSSDTELPFWIDINTWENR